MTVGLTVEDLRRKRKDGTPVAWNHCYGIVLRVAKDGTWADMWWWQGTARLNGPAEGYPNWRKRSPLANIAEWRHG